MPTCLILHFMAPPTQLLLCAVLSLFSVAQLGVRLGLLFRVCMLCMLVSHQAFLAPACISLLFCLTWGKFCSMLLLHMDDKHLHFPTVLPHLGLPCSALPCLSLPYPAPSTFALPHPRLPCPSSGQMALPCSIWDCPHPALMMPPANSPSVTHCIMCLTLHVALM